MTDSVSHRLIVPIAHIWLDTDCTSNVHCAYGSSNRQTPHLARQVLALCRLVVRPERAHDQALGPAGVSPPPRIRPRARDCSQRRLRSHTGTIRLEQSVSTLPALLIDIGSVLSRRGSILKT